MSGATMQEIGSWTLAIMSLAGAYHIGNKRRGAWLWMFFTQLIWIAYGALTRQTGFVAAGLGFGAMNVRNWRRWRREDRSTELEG